MSGVAVAGSGIVSRRAGGLETPLDYIEQVNDVSRRAGGLEIDAVEKQQDKTVSRRAGGLENPK